MSGEGELLEINLDNITSEKIFNKFEIFSWQENKSVIYCVWGLEKGMIISFGRENMVNKSSLLREFDKSRITMSVISEKIFNVEVIRNEQV